jgi:hypothetical protein
MRKTAQPKSSNTAKIYGRPRRKRRSQGCLRTSIKCRPAPWNSTMNTKRMAPIPIAANGLFHNGILARSLGIPVTQLSRQRSTTLFAPVRAISTPAGKVTAVITSSWPAR